MPKKGSTEVGAQIDLLFDREDKTITVCEIKYSAQPFIIDKQYAKELLNKIKIFQLVSRIFDTKNQGAVCNLCFLKEK